jgi:uncharacterized membrane protein YcaP (DUF421 family)
MDLLIKIFGEGKDLNTLQMSCRGVAIFLIALVLIRISGRRSFGLHTPLDNIIVILLGATLSRAIVGANPFVPVVAACFIIVLLHRVLTLIISRNKKISKFMEGGKILLFENGRFIKENLRKALVCEEDILQEVRKSALTANLDKIDKVYMEHNGEISAIKKELS